jgi:mannonate dehydratase
VHIQDKVTWGADVDEKLGLVSTLGLDCVAFDLPDSRRGNPVMDFSTRDSIVAFLKAAKQKVAGYGMDLRTVLATSGFDAIKRGLPGRDEQIAYLLDVVHAMGEAGIPVLAYNFKLLNSKLLRSAPTQGRGTSTYISFDYDEYLKKPAPPISPALSEQQVFDNLAYFLKALVPAAEKASVRMALHPDDPPVPAGTPALAGAAHVVSSFEQYHKIFDIVPSRSNGMLFCQGCVKEMKGMDVYEGIRHMGSRDKIVMVHFRNVRGAFPRFQETFVDNGDVDMFRAMQAYRDVGFKGPFSLDHSPMFPGADSANQAFVIGYMRALIQAVYR